ncbi:hypothetical protein ACJ41O_001421 [Fusarium nematophilum]
MFEYNPISKERSEFRLVRLACDPDANVINLALRHASASDDVAYHAVSYVWGDPKDVGDVAVDGQIFSVSQNLIALFRQLLRLKLDLEEKSWQVNAMGRIYGSVKWLGRRQAQPADYKALSTGKKPHSRAHPVVHFLYNLYQERGLRRHSEERPLDKYPLLDGTRDLLDRPFWRRVWIVQEITLALDAVIMCGSETVSMEYFSEAISSLKLCMAVFHDFGCSSFLNRLVSRFFSTMTLSVREHLRTGAETSLVHVLLGTGSFSGPRYLATEPRDIIFGMLSIVRERESFGLQVDYRELVGTLFARATKGVYRLCSPTLNDDWEDSTALDDLEPSSAPGLPSWGPDYEAIGKSGLDIHTIKYHCSAYASKGAPNPQLIPAPEEDPMILYRRGRRLHLEDTLLTFKDVFEEEDLAEDLVQDPDVCRFMRAMFRGEEIDPDKAQKVQDKFDDSDSEDEEWENVDSQGEDSDGERSGSEESTDESSDDEPDEESTEEKLMSIFRNVFPGLNGRTLVKTAIGMIRMGRTNVDKGDVVTLIWAVPSPILLRPEGSQYRYLGDAYVDRIMKGEFLAREPDEVTFDLV